MPEHYERYVRKWRSRIHRCAARQQACECDWFRAASEFVATFLRDLRRQDLLYLGVDSIHPDIDAEIEKILPPEISQERRDELGGGPEPITFAGLLASGASVNAAPPFPDVPLVVLRHGVPFESSHDDFPSAAVEALWAHLEDELAALLAVFGRTCRRTLRTSDSPGPTRPRRCRDRGRG